jgi:hypothetical protein
MMKRREFIRLAAETQFFVGQAPHVACLDSLSAVPLDPLRTRAAHVVKLGSIAAVH